MYEKEQALQLLSQEPTPQEIYYGGGVSPKNVPIIIANGDAGESRLIEGLYIPTPVVSVDLITLQACNA